MKYLKTYEENNQKLVNKFYFGNENDIKFINYTYMDKGDKPHERHGGDTFKDEGEFYSLNTSYSSPNHTLDSKKLYTSQEFFDEFGLDVCYKLYSTLLKKEEKKRHESNFSKQIKNELLKITEIKVKIESQKFNL